MKFEGKKAVVTGGGSGIGAAICRELAKEGADIAIFDIALDNAEKVAREVRELGREALVFKVDVASFSDVDASIKDVYARFKRIDFLINNAGSEGEYVRFGEMSEEMWDRCVRINLKGVFNCTRAAINGMIDQGGGKIISMSSCSGVSGSPTHSHYSAAKAGIIGLSQALAKETAHAGITVNVIAPGTIDTPLARRASQDVVKMVIKRTPVGRMGKPEEIAGACCFLLSEEANFITGQVLRVDGGYLI